MSITYQFLYDCGYYFLATSKDNIPSLRPFGAVLEYANEIYFSTSNKKDVYDQLMSNPSIEIVAIDVETKHWIRVCGKALEIQDLEIKQKMLVSKPNLIDIYKNVNNPDYCIFKITEMKSWLNTEDDTIQLH